MLSTIIFFIIQIMGLTFAFKTSLNNKLKNRQTQVTRRSSVSKSELYLYSKILGSTLNYS